MDKAETINQDQTQNLIEPNNIKVFKPRTLDKLVKFRDVPELIDFMSKIVKGKNINVSTVEDALSAYVKCNELGIGWANGLDHLHSINGRLGVDFHIITALVLRKGVNIHWEVLENAVPVYEYVTKIGDKVTTIQEDDLTENCVIVSPLTPKEVNDNYRNNGKIPVIKKQKVICNYTMGGVTIPFYDKRTTIRFTREIKVGNKTKTLTIDSSFSNFEAFVAGLLFDKDGNFALDKPWFKYNTNQLYVRAFTIGARRLGDDVLLGVYEASELFDINNIDYQYDGDRIITVDVE